MLLRLRDNQAEGHDFNNFRDVPFNFLIQAHTVPIAEQHTYFESWMLVDVFDSKSIEKMFKLDQGIDAQTLNYKIKNLEKKFLQFWLFKVYPQKHLASI